MLRGIYNSASGMIANQRRSEALTNNLANSQSTGYKADEAVFRSFPEYLISAVQSKRSPLPPNAPVMGQQKLPLGKLPQGVYTHEMIPDFKQGDLQETGSPFDFAIMDDHLPAAEQNGRLVQARLFFAVQKNGETFYTRNGNFTIDALNQLVAGDGSLIMDSEGNPITLPNDRFQIDARGYLYDEFGQAIQRTPNEPNEQPYPIQLQVVQVDNPYDLIKTENGAFRWQGQGAPALAGELVRLKQGFVERSNVNVQQTIVDLTQTARSFESNQKVLSAYNQTLERLFESSRLS